MADARAHVDVAAVSTGDPDLGRDRGPVQLVSLGRREDSARGLGASGAAARENVHRGRP